MLASPGEVTAAIEIALERVRTFFRADRCSLLAVSADQQTVNVTQASYANDLVRVPSEVNLAEMFPWCRRRVLEGVPTVVPRLADLPPEAAEDRASWAALATLSSLAVPIFSGARASHLIAMATAR